LPTPGDTICGEILLEHLASASLGAEVFQPVFVARDLGRDESLWLTVVDGVFTPTSVDLSAFMAGANALMSVRHPSLVRVVLVDREEDYCVVGYEQLAGAESLSDMVARGDSRRVLARAAVEVARGLAFLHRRGLLHGALTPNTVVLWEGAPVLWEHGLAALCDPTVFGPRSRSMGGDVVAPEVPSGAPLTPAADVYAWGAVMAAVASGELGAEAVAAVLEGDVDPGRHGLLLGVVRQALAPEPGRRPRDGVHLLELLQRALASADPNTELEAPSSRDGGDDAVRELASRYLAEMASLERKDKAAARKAAGAAGEGPKKPVSGPVAAAAAPGALGRLALVKRAPGEASGPHPAAEPDTPEEASAPASEPDWSGRYRLPSGAYAAVRDAPPATGPGLVRGPEPGVSGADAGSLAVGPASPSESSARWVTRSPETSASGWLRPAPPRVPGGGKGGLFDARRGLVDHPDGVRKRSIVSPRAIPRPPEARIPPRQGAGIPKSLADEDVTPREALPLGSEPGDDDALRGLFAPELLGDVPQSERETPTDVAILRPGSAAGGPDRGRGARGAAPRGGPRRSSSARLESLGTGKREREPEPDRDLESDLPALEPDLPDLHEEHELPPMPEAEPEAAPELPPMPARAEPVAAKKAGRSKAPAPFRMPRTPGPHGPPAALMAGVLAVLCGVTAVAATLSASSVRGGLPRLWSSDEADPDADAAEDAGAGGGGEALGAGPCPPGMVEIHAQPLPFCIDRAEYPGLDRVPTTDVDLSQAEAACEARGHALCSEAEWTRACQGPSTWPFPYGPKREAGRCRVDDGTAAPGPSGADPHCVTPEGVLDLVGNVAEWTKGGAVMGGSVRSPKTTACDARQRLKARTATPVIGFRCCLALEGEGGSGSSGSSDG
jgi:Protein kinase domain/Sulfatase-modifying factor enzyme 1